MIKFNIQIYHVLFQKEKKQIYHVLYQRENFKNWIFMKVKIINFKEIIKFNTIKIIHFKNPYQKILIYLVINKLIIFIIFFLLVMILQGFLSHIFHQFIKTMYFFDFFVLRCKFHFYTQKVFWLSEMLRVLLSVAARQSAI